ncbi:MAG: FdhF/YdeP family oxidoreductase [Vulcanimicrobiota bacterium]
MKQDDPSQTSNSDFTPTPPARVAGGLGSVREAARAVSQQTGWWRGLGCLKRANQEEGFDCHGCAWPEPEHRSRVEFCESGVKAIADEATTRRLAGDFFAQHSLAQLAQQSDQWLNAQGRLTEPVVLEPGADHYRPIEWEDAFRLVGQRLQTLASPAEAVFYSSGRTSNEAAFLYGLLARTLGTNNLPDCSDLCHESSVRALREVIGHDGPTVRQEDFYRADLIVVVGQNPGSNHPRMLDALEQARANGARVISLNPLPEAGLVRFKNPRQLVHPIKAFNLLMGEGTPMCDLHLPVRINGDLAVFKGMLKALLEREEERPNSIFDHQFLRQHTRGYAAFADDLRSQSWGDVLRSSGLSRDLIERAAEMVARSRRIIISWAMGVTQQPNAVATIQQMVNLLLVRGCFGKPGAGLCPLAGHSNLQGVRRAGITERPDGEFLKALGQEFGFTPPLGHGYDVVSAIHAMLAGQVKVFVGLGGNFALASPDSVRTAQALAGCELSVQISTKLNRSHLVTAGQALILPTLGRTEIDRQAGGPQFITVEDALGRVHASRGHLEPASPQLKSEVAILAGLAQAALPQSRIPWKAMAEDYDRIRHHLGQVVPALRNFNYRARRQGGFYPVNPPREGRFETADGKAHFTVHPVPSESTGPSQFLLMSVRAHDQFNTSIYRPDDRYRGIHGDRKVVLANPQDLVEQGFRQGQRVDITSHFQGTQRSLSGFAIVPYPIPRGCLACYFPEANALTALESVAEGSNTPTFKHIVVSLKASS